MTQVNFSHRALKDLERIFDFLIQVAPDIATQTAEEIVDATSILQRHPLIGRPVGDFRELVISKGRTGYVALYRYLPEKDRVDILILRHQRESGLAE